MREKYEVPYVAIGNDELGASVKKGDLVRSDSDNLQGYLDHGTDMNTGKESTIMGFVSVKGGASYLVSIQGKLLDGWRIINEQDV